MARMPYHEGVAADYLIAGGGIGGTVLAELLGRGGKRVVVLERGVASPSFLRPEVLWPATMEALWSLVPRAAWEREASVPLHEVRIHRGGGRSTPLITPDIVREAGVQPWFTNPNRTREILLSLGSFELRRGVEVTGVLRERERVVGVRARELAGGGELELPATWVVADDGVQSVIRKATGIEMPTRMFPVDFLCFICAPPAADFPLGTAHVLVNPNGGRSGILGLLIGALPGGSGTGLVLARSRIFDDLAAAREAWDALRRSQPAIDRALGPRRFPEDFTRVRRPWGHAARYGADGVILMGDAAHSVSPAGGQGANMSVADALVLAELSLRGGPNLVAEYERIRRPANQRSFGPTRTVSRLLGLPDRLAPFGLLVNLVGCVGRQRWLLRRALRSTSELFAAARS